MSEQDMEDELRELFERSAETADDADLTRLRARAADVPERAPRSPRWLPRWVWAPALGGVCASAGALGALWFSETGPLATQTPREAAPAIASAAELAAPSASTELRAPEVIQEAVADDEPLSFDLSADVPDAELDAWLDALEGS